MLERMLSLELEIKISELGRGCRQQDQQSEQDSHPDLLSYKKVTQ